MPFFRKSPSVVTHSGDFHADDVFAGATLELALGKTLTFTRTRDPQKIAEAEYVFDVGGVYDAKKKRFDHHQAGGAGKRENGIPYAAFGLVWKSYGAEAVTRAGKLFRKSDGYSSAALQVAADIDRKIIAAVDADDNGVNLYKPTFEDVEPYLVHSLISSFKPTWQESRADDAFDTSFRKAVDLAKFVLTREIEKAKARIAAAGFVLEAYSKSPDKRLVVLSGNYPWSEALKDMKEVLFVAYSKAPNDWRLGAVRKEQGSFANRKDLPASWAGKSGADFAAVTGVPDAMFCHNGRFLAIAKSKAGILKLAELALSDSGK